ncbi:type II toxin-antitoxin system VapC family toxin [Leptolyngbya sp. AN03gr2]|uniref:type II toxin-antitoxin system VapC family toxin n=1 Tax=unclassified Leptolyngbya TaxID=2650499 RepID=UPI003D322FF6
MSYLDTSIIVPAYCTEPLSNRVDEVLLQEVELIISNLTEVEFYSALSRKVRQRQLTLDEAQQISIDFQSDLDAGIYQRLQIEAVHSLSVGARLDLPIRYSVENTGCFTFSDRA